MKVWRSLLRIKVAAGLCLALAACNLSPQTPGTTPKPRPVVETIPPTAKSTAARDYYAKVQKNLLAEGLLRTDGGGRDAPFNARVLADNFLRIAFFSEYTRTGDALIQKESASRLRRWQVPVRVGLRFGASVSAETQATDRAKIASYLARLARLTGHSISLSETEPNFLIHIVSEDEREALGPKLRATLPSMTDGDVAGITALPPATYCIVYAQADGLTGAYTRAVAVIRSEHPDLLGLACVHEEIAQGLGLANDSPRARPSIFNDDNEYALLTDQDELMLRMLYNPALRPGMTLDEARPLVETLAKALLGGQS